MKKFRIISFVMAAMLCVFMSCEREEPVSVEFKAPSYQLKVGETMDIIAELVIKNTDAKPVFTSSDAAVAVVADDGKLNALAQGETVIKAVVEGKEATCTVAVTEIQADKITLTAPESLSADETWGTVTAAVEPAGYDADNLEWTFTPSAEGLEFETEKVKSNEYKIRFKTFVEGGKLTVKVADKISGMAQTADIAVTEKVVPATRISLEMPQELTEGEELWASVKATVTPEEYDAEHLVWEFEPSSADLGFKYEKVSATEYKVCFSAYVEGGFVKIKVTDELSEVFNEGRIKVLEKPEEGLRTLSLTPATLALNVGDEPVKLQVVYEPADYDKSLLEWTSSDESVVTFADGVVTVIGEGEAVVKVKDTVSGKEASCAVTVITPVKEAEVARIGLSKTVLEMRVGEDAVQLVAKCYDAEDNIIENYAGLVWSAEKMKDENGKEINVVEVTQQGVVTPKNPGTTQVVVADKDRAHIKAICNVTVKAAEVKVEEVRLVPDSKIIDMEESFTLTAVITPENAENKTLTYTSSDDEVATVTAEGVVTGVKPGKAVITATSVNGVKGQCEVTVAEETWVYLSNTEITIVVGEEAVLTATVTPENAPDKTVTWTSSDPEVASVDGGKVKGVAEGTAIITASANGKSAECKVTVEPDIVDFDITIVPSEATVLTRGLQQDKSVRLLATYKRTDNDKDYVPAVTAWKSSDETIATVDSEGNVTAVAEVVEKYGLYNGLKVTITHTADHIEQPIEIVVVRAQPEKIVFTALPSVDGVEGKIMHGESFRLEAKVLPEKATQAVGMFKTNPDGGYGGVLTDCMFHADEVGLYSVMAYVETSELGGLDGINQVPATVAIEVLPVKITEMTMSNESLEMTTGSQATLKVSIAPTNASYKAVRWSSSDEAVATVDQNGIVTAKAAGEVVVTATQTENNISCTCSITVTDPVVEINVGDYYYSDGSTSAELDASKNVIGIVFSTNNPSQQGDLKLAEEYPECTHGYVVSTVEYMTPCAVGRGWSWADLGAWCTANGYQNYSSEVNSCGYANTEGYIAANAAEIDSWGNTIDFTLFGSTSPLITHRNDVSVPDNASPWYIPSFREMQLLYENRDAVNASIDNISGDSLHVTRTNYDDYMYQYWTSSYDLDNKIIKAFNMTNGSWYGLKTETTSLPVRVILAF